MQPSSGGFLMDDNDPGCQRCGRGPVVMLERNLNPDGHPVWQRAIVCGACILDQYIEWEWEDVEEHPEGETNGESE
jgi:hypothetical protein